MTAREYLEQIRRQDAVVQNLQEEKDEMRRLMTGLRSPSAGERVQSSRQMDRIGDLFVKMEEKEQEILREIDVLVDMRTEAVRLINQLPKALYVRILYKRYIDYKPWKEIEAELNYSKSYMAVTRDRALQCFEEVHGEFLQRLGIILVD